MRLLDRNKSTIWFADYKSTDEYQDEFGYYTGEQIVTYQNPIKTQVHVSAAKGEAATMEFGDKLEYDRVFIHRDVDLPLSESGVCWIDCEPVIEPDGSTNTPYDYKVVKIAKSLNHLSIAVRKVHVS